MTPARPAPVERMGIPPPGFRLPAQSRLGVVALQIADLGRALAFYQDILGFQLLSRGDGPHGRFARLGAASAEPHPRVLLELREKSGVRPVPRRGLLGIYHFAVLLPTRADLGRFLQHAAARGVHVSPAEHLISEALYLVDPDGITVEICRDRPRAEWRYKHGEVVADTLPLDTGPLAAAAGDTAWTGLPAGTTMGHVHFYVGDIPRAEAFYFAALGLDKTIWSIPGVLFVSTGGYHHHVGLNTWAAGAPLASEDDAKLLTWELLVPDQAGADAAAERLRGAEYAVTTSDGAYEASDPWGITVRIAATSSSQV